MALILYPDLKRLKGIPYCRDHLARLERRGKFPARVQVGERRVGWLEEEIDAYIAERVAARREPEAA
jgi:prophage regulatory protein